MLEWIVYFLIGWFLYDTFRSFTDPNIGQPEYGIKKEKRQQQQLEPSVIIVGAGAAGLSVAAHLRKEKIPFLVVEKGKDSGSVWRGRYERLHLHTTKDVSHLPFMPFPSNYPVYPSRLQVADYLEAYAKATVGLSSILYNHEVKRADYNQSTSTWTVTVENVETKEQKEYKVKSLVVATGENAIPKIPKFAGQESFKGKIIHSTEYFNGEPFRGQKVLIVGFGNSGAELSIDLWEHDARPSITVRSPVNITPRWFIRIASDFIQLRLRASFLITQEGLPRKIFGHLYSDLNNYGIVTPSPKAAIEELTQAHNPPMIDIGQIDLIRKRQVIVVNSEIDKFTENGVLFKNGKEETYDAVILATGFQKAASFASFVDEKVVKGSLNSYGVVKNCICDNNIYYIGYGDFIGRFRHMGIEAGMIAQHIKTH